jgi:replicative DNA helicase
MMERDTALDWERSVIATAITEPSSIEEALELLPSDFTGPNQIAWAEILNLHSRGGIDARALSNALNNSADFERMSAGEPVANYLADVLTFRGTNMTSYVQMVIDRSIRRQLRRYAGLIAAEADNDSKKIDELLDFAEQKILTLRHNRQDQDLSMADIMGIFIPRMEGLLAGTIQPGWVPETLAVRNIIDYMEDEDFLVNAARPGEGKSSWMRYEFYLAAKLHNRSCAILNYENAPIEYARYFLAIETQIDSKKLKMPSLMTPQEREQVRAAAERISRLPIRVVTTRRTVSAAISAARRLASTQGITLLGLDYIQLLNNGLENRVNDISLTTATLRAFALDTKIPVIANCQLSREIERRGNNRNNGDEQQRMSGEAAEPELSDLRESGSIEQDATQVIFPRPMRNVPISILSMFPENWDNNVLQSQRPRVVPVFFYVKKNRNGTAAKSDPVAWLKHTDTYRTLERNRLESAR